MRHNSARVLLAIRVVAEQAIGGEGLHMLNEMQFLCVACPV